MSLSTRSRLLQPGDLVRYNPTRVASAESGVVIRVNLLDDDGAADVDILWSDGVMWTHQFPDDFIERVDHSMPPRLIEVINAVG